MPALVQIWHRLVFCKRRCPLSNTTCILRSHGMETSCIKGRPKMHPGGSCAIKTNQNHFVLRDSLLSLKIPYKVSNQTFNDGNFRCPSPPGRPSQGDCWGFSRLLFKKTPDSKRRNVSCNLLRIHFRCQLCKAFCLKFNCTTTFGTSSRGGCREFCHESNKYLSNLG